MPTIGEEWREGARLLSGDAAHLEAGLLLEHALAKPRTWLIAHADDPLDPEPLAAFRKLLARRARGEPVAYITGARGFYNVDLRVTPDVLIPRPETELLVELALRHIPAGADCSIADLGTGSGAIALALARARPQARVIATDASAHALAVAADNAARLGLRNVTFARGDWCGALGDARLDLIVSNPPYIRVGDAHLAQGDLRFEPAVAMVAGADGLDAIRVIARDAPGHLHSGGWLLLEHGFDQGAAVRVVLRECGFARVSTWQDLERRDRVTGGQV